MITQRLDFITLSSPHKSQSRSIHRHQTPPRYCHVIRRRSLHLSASLPLRPNVTSSTKPDVHNVVQRRPRRTEPRPQGICTKKFRKDRSSGSRDMLADSQTYRQTHRQNTQTDKLIAIPRSPTAGRSNKPGVIIL